MSWGYVRGLRWQNLQLDFYVLAVDIAPDGRIWAGSGGGKVWSSANRSKWERVGAFSNGAFSYRNMRIQFADALHGFVQQGDEFSETVDGGQTWTPLVTFKAAGVLAFSKSERRVYKQANRVDLPKAWTVTNNEHRHEINDIEGFGDHKHSIALGPHGEILVTNNGSSWRRASAP